MDRDSYALLHRQQEQGSNSSSTAEALQSVLEGRRDRSRKTLRTGQDVWPPHLEAALLDALAKYVPDDTREALVLGRYRGRNQFISQHIFQATGEWRSSKQVGSRIQQLRLSTRDPAVKKLLDPVLHTPSAAVGLSYIPPPSSEYPAWDMSTPNATSSASSSTSPSRASSKICLQVLLPKVPLPVSSADWPLHVSYDPNGHIIQRLHVYGDLHQAFAIFELHASAAPLVSAVTPLSLSLRCTSPVESCTQRHSQ